MKYFKLYEDKTNNDFLVNIAKNALQNNKKEILDVAIDKGLDMKTYRGFLRDYCINTIYNFESLKLICVNDIEYEAILESIIILRIEKKDITKIKFETFKHLPNLTHVIINESTNIKDVEFLKHIPNLKKLEITRSKRTLDLSGLKHTRILKELVLGYNNLTNIESLKGLYILSYLNLNYNKIVDLTPIKDLHGLKRLTIGGNPVKSFKPLKNLVNLEKFYFDPEILDLPNDETVLLYETTEEIILLLNTHIHELGGISFKYALTNPNFDMLAKDYEGYFQNTKLFYLRKVYFDGDQREPQGTIKDKEDWLKNVYTPYFEKYVKPWIEEQGWYLWSY